MRRQLLEALRRYEKALLAYAFRDALDDCSKLEHELDNARMLYIKILEVL